MKTEKKTNTANMALTSLLLVLIALAGVTAATLAWFSISDHTRVYSMDMDITTGASLRFDLDPHNEFIEYLQTLRSEQIFARIASERGFDPLNTPLDPVTTEDAQTFTLRNGSVQSESTGKYLTFTLHFMATEDMDVHLSSADSSAGAQDGTCITSAIENLPAAMRISFTCEGKTTVYDPGATKSYQNSESICIFGLPRADSMIYNDDNRLFNLKANTDTPVVVHIWMEGTDEACTNQLKGGDYSVRLRFVGTDEGNNPIGGK